MEVKLPLHQGLYLQFVSYDPINLKLNLNLHIPHGCHIGQLGSVSAFTVLFPTEGKRLSGLPAGPM